MSEFTHSGYSYVMGECPACGVLHAFPMIIHRQAKENRGPRGRQIHCPNGHEWHYTGETEAETLRRERDRLKQEAARLEEMRAAANRSRDAAEEARRKAEAKLTQHKKRASAGTCPCCKRTFSALAAHMKTKHPEFITEQGAKVIPIKAGAA